MRWVVLVLAVLGALASFGLGTLWMLDVAFTPRAERQAIESLIAMAEPEVWTKYERELRLRTRGYPFLLASGVLGFVGGALAAARRKWIAAATLLVAGIGPGVIHPSAWIYTSLLILAGLLAFTISTRPAAIPPPRRPARRREIDDRDDESDD